MSQNVAPWLQGLDMDVTWKSPVHMSSASHDATSLAPINKQMNGSVTSRASMRSISGTRQTGLPAQSSLLRNRSPLATIDHNDQAANRSSIGTTKITGTRSLSFASNESVSQRGTVQQRAKSASPVKKQETLEWKRRLMHGQVGYGDQTDLFGPSGLENIFAQTRTPETTNPRPKTRVAWMNGYRDGAIPSSPPAWPLQQSLVEDISGQEYGCQSPQSLTRDEQGHASSNGTCRASALKTQSHPIDLDDQVRWDITGKSTPNKVGSVQSRSKQQVKSNGDAIGNRTIGGQTELEQEDFSPVFISKHTTTNGSVGYRTLDPHTIKQFQKRHVSLRHSYQQAAAEEMELRHINDTEVTGSPLDIAEHPQCDSILAAPEFSMSENLPTGTPPVVPLSANVELQRGGYSRHGSFKQKPLSSSNSAGDVSEVLDGSAIEPDLSTSVHVYPPAPTPPYAEPRTPNHGLQTSEPPVRSSGSPLKLFGAHDTFTNNRLMRRISTLDIEGSLAPPEHSGLSHTGDGQVDMQPRSEGRLSQASFGSGHLDEHEFAAEISLASTSQSDEDDGDQSPGSEIPPPGSKTPLNFRAERETVDSDPFKLKSRITNRFSRIPKPVTAENTPRREVILNATLGHALADDSNLNVVIQKVIEPTVGTGKRPPNSPCKDSTPKRRRTLHASELVEQSSDVNDSMCSRGEDNSNSRKRKDARPGNVTNLANPEVLARRKLIRPRNATQAERRKQQIEAEIRDATEQFATEEPEKLVAVMEQIESTMASDSPPSVQQQARVVANEVAKFTLRVQKASGDFSEIGERKRSVTTQDFFNEAVMVMKLIREKAGRQSALSSLAESDQEPSAHSLTEDQPALDNSALSVSRPPSREGGVAWRPRTSQQTNARVISHLKKFQEIEDTEYLAPSIGSLDINDEQEAAVVVVDEQSNIRIKAQLPANVHQTHLDNSSRPPSQRTQQSTVNSLSIQDSAASSTEGNLNNSSTRKSENVGTLAPDAVAHLIGEQVGGMTFDKEKQQWIRAKHSPQKSPGRGSFLEIPSSLSASDDDPFREISDLAIDERKEEQMRTTSYDFKRQLQMDNASTRRTDASSKALHPTIESRTTSEESIMPRPMTGDSNHSMQTYTTAGRSRDTALTSSQAQQPETRATSWTHTERRSLSAYDQKGQHLLEHAMAKGTLASLEERPDRETGGRLSEGIDERLDDEEVDEEGLSSCDGLGNDTSMCADSSRIDDLESPKLRQTPTRTFFTQQPSLREPRRQVSMRRQALTGKFRSDAMEQSELSFVATLPGERTMSVSLSVSRPVTSRQPHGQVLAPQTSPSKADPSFMLSDLPDFTIHEVDEERPSERALANRLAQHAAAEVGDRYALAVKDLVKTLTDVQQEELYWEDTTHLDLCSRKMTSLHGLGDFCSGVQNIDLSNNSLAHLDGAPTSIRQLSARSNQLSSLTSWTHLMNLQYLDISRNEISSLDGLACLVHLRELTADDNDVADIRGLLRLDGLLKLRMRRNRLHSLDLSHSRLNRLEQLDVAGNEISAINGLECLSALRSLKLDGNPLKGGFTVERPLAHLHRLSLSSCQVESLDVSNMAAIRTLMLDDNRLQQVDGVEKLESLDLLSMRRQTLPDGASISVLHQAVHARSICLSGNNIPALSLSHPLLGLRHLEMASTGLSEVPDDFGVLLPNLKTLNLNFNALKDIRPLLNIHRLEEFSACGNRLHRLRKTVAVLAKMPSLNRLDLRDNPLTLGYYGPRCLAAPTKHTSVVRREAAARGNEGDEDHISMDAESARHVLPEADTELDRQHCLRLDEETKLRRRVYHLLLGNSCAKLTRLDGLPFEKARALVKDDIWGRLVELDIVRKSSD